MGSLHNQQDHVVKFRNGSEVLFRELTQDKSDPEMTKLAGLALTGFFADEANEITEKCFSILNSRVRYQIDENGLNPKALLNCNPNTGWIYDKFYKPWKNGVLQDEKKFVPALHSDNYKISKHYVSQLLGTDPITQQRLLYGDWEYTEDNILFDFDRVLEMFGNDDYVPETGSTKYYLSVDVARMGKDSTVMMVWQNNTIIDCLTVNKQELDKQLSIVQRLQSAYNIPNENIVMGSTGVSFSDFIPNCVKFIGGSKAINDGNYLNLRTQCYYLLRKQIGEGNIKFSSAKMEVKNMLVQELMNIKAKNIDSDRKLQISSKEEIKKAISRSPDYSDCLSMKMYFNISQGNAGIQPTGEYYFRVGSIRR